MPRLLESKWTGMTLMLVMIGGVILGDPWMYPALIIAGLVMMTIAVVVLVFLILLIVATIFATPRMICGLLQVMHESRGGDDIYRGL